LRIRSTANLAADPDFGYYRVMLNVRVADLMRLGTAAGTRFRSRRSGPEADLVDRFVDALPLSTPRDCRTTLFREPRLLSGFPDLVAVTWHVPTTERWTGARREIATADLRLLQLLVSSGPASETDLAGLLGNVAASLRRLETAGLVRKRAGTWVSRRLEESFAVRGIVAFEAKISDWAQAIQQASANRWFASESYVLVPAVPRRGMLLAQARRAGVGVWVEGENTPVQQAPSNIDRQPMSFASWLFNEWAWLDASPTRGAKRRTA
jgi:hypothetical protein